MRNHGKESTRSKSKREKTANLLAKVHRQHSEGKGNELERSRRDSGIHLNRIDWRKCLTD